MVEFTEPVERSTRLRSLVKTISWRVVATLITWIVVFLFTGGIAESTRITLVSAAFLTAGYYLHERIWARLRFTDSPAR